MSLLYACFLIAVVSLFGVGVYSLLVTRNLMRILISIEILTKGVTLLFIVAGYMSGNLGAAEAYVITIIIMEVALLVVATGIVFGVYKENGILNTNKLNNLKG